MHPRHHWKRLAVQAVVVSVAITVIVLGGVALESDIPAIEQWIEDQGAWMPVIFCAIFLVASLFCLPADIFVFSAGTLFGLWWGFFCAALTEYLAMVAQYYLARGLLKSRMETFLVKHPKFAAIDRAVGDKGLKIAFLLRLGPVPFSPLSYILGVSRIKFGTYMLASPGILLSLFAVSYYGMLAQHLTRLATGQEHHSAIHYISMIFGAVVAMVTSVYVGRVARKALKESAAI